MKTTKQQAYRAIYAAVSAELDACRADYLAADTEQEAAVVVARARAITARRNETPKGGGRLRSDLQGMTFGRLLAVADAGSRAGKNPLWLCVCTCGTRKVVEAMSLARGDTASCGCLRRERCAERARELAAARRAARRERKPPAWMALLPKLAPPPPPQAIKPPKAIKPPAPPATPKPPKPPAPPAPPKAVSRPAPIPQPHRQPKSREAMLLSLGRSMRLVYARWSEVAEACGEEIAAELRAEAMAERGAV